MFEQNLTNNLHWERWLGVLHRWPEQSEALRDWASERLEWHGGDIESVLRDAENLQAWPELKTRLTRRVDWNSWANVTQDTTDARSFGSIAVERLDKLTTDEPSPEQIRRVLLNLLAEEQQASAWKSRIRHDEMQQRLRQDQQQLRNYRTRVRLSLAVAATCLLIVGLTQIRPDVRFRGPGDEVITGEGLIPTVRIGVVGDTPRDIKINGARLTLELDGMASLFLQQIGPPNPERMLITYGIDDSQQIAYLNDDASLLTLSNDRTEIAISSDIQSLILVSLPKTQRDQQPEQRIQDGRRAFNLPGEVIIVGIDLRRGP